MRLLRYQREDGSPAWGLLEEGKVFDLLGAPFESHSRGAAVGDVEEVTLLAPTVPSKVVCIGRNYAAHVDEMGHEQPAAPVIFLKPPSAVIGPGAAIVLPTLSEQVEHEAELALVIGQRCRNLSEADAMAVVFGFTCGNDVTARDLQRQDDQWARAKGFDTFCPLGPWVITPDEFDPGGVPVQCHVNGEVRQNGNTDQLIFALPRLLRDISAVMTLEPGDVVMTGTPAGVGPLHAGDVVEVAVEGIGVLRNPVMT